MNQLALQKHRWSQKIWIIFSSLYLLYVTTQKGIANITMFSYLSSVKLVLRILPHLNILCTSSERPHYTESMPINSYHDVVHNFLEFTVVVSLWKSFKLTEIQRVCHTPWTSSQLILAVGLAPFLSRSGLPDPAVYQNALQIINVSDLLNIQFLL